MDSIADLLKTLSIINFEVGSSHWVDVTHINNPHSFYVRPTEYRMFMPVLHSYGERMHSSDMVLRQNVIYKSKLVQSFVRGQVMHIQTEEDGETTCDLYAPDYGYFERSVPMKRIRQPIITVNVPPLAVHCQLADCQPLGETWTRKVIECMKFYVGKERARMDIRGKSTEALLVELINSCPDDIATMLALCGYTTLGYGEQMVSVFPSTTPENQYFTFKQLNVGDELTVRVQTGESLTSFYVALIADYKKYLRERDNFTYSSKKENVFKVENVKVGLPVAVLLDMYTKYERAFVMEITVPDERVKVHLIDWGKVLEVPYTRLKPISSSFFMYPATAIYCTADENQAWDNGLQRFLYPGYEFKITVVAAGDKFESPNVVNISPKESISGNN